MGIVFVCTVFFRYSLKFYLCSVGLSWRTAVTQWLRRCATHRKVAGSIPDGVIGIVSQLGLAFDTAFNRNEYQEYFLGV